MDIALTSMVMSQAKTTTNVGTAVLNMSLDTLEQSGVNTVKMMEQSVNPNLGQTIDIQI